MGLDVSFVAVGRGVGRGFFATGCGVGLSVSGLGAALIVGHEATGIRNKTTGVGQTTGVTPWRSCGEAYLDVKLTFTSIAPLSTFAPVTRLFFGCGLFSISKWFTFPS